MNGNPDYEMSEYAIALQRAIEAHCRGRMADETDMGGCPWHAKMLNRYLTRSADVAWHGWKAATSQPRVWLVVDDQGNPEFCAGWPQACHEHINEALGTDIEEAKTWHVRQAVLMPLPPNT